MTPSLCETCARMREVLTPKGSRFLLCQLSQTDPDYPKYPRLMEDDHGFRCADSDNRLRAEALSQNEGADDDNNKLSRRAGE